MLNGDKQAVINYRITPGGSLQGKIRMPGDKSISHRSIMLGAVAEGKTEISGFLEGADCLATLQAFTELGVQVARPDTGKLTIHGVGLQGLKAPHQILDLGNSGTSIRLLTGLLAGQKFSSQLTGDASLQRRPMARVVRSSHSHGSKHRDAGKWMPTPGHSRRATASRDQIRHADC